MSGSSRRERSGMRNRSSSARQHIFITNINTNHHNQPNTPAKHILPPSCGEGSLPNTLALDAVQLNVAWASMSPNALSCMSGLFCAPVPIRHVQLGPAGILLGTSASRHSIPMRQAVHEAARLLVRLILAELEVWFLDTSCAVKPGTPRGLGPDQLSCKERYMSSNCYEKGQVGLWPHVLAPSLGHLPKETRSKKRW